MAEVEIASRHFLPGRAWARAEGDNEALQREGRTDYRYRVRPAVRGPFRWYVVLEEGARRPDPMTPLATENGAEHSDSHFAPWLETY